MAQTIFDALAGGVSVDNQAALVVQSLLDSQNVAEATQQEEEDLFQCGKCKKQFTSLPSFISHKQGRCTPPATLRPVPQQTVVSTNPTAFTTTIQQQRQTVQTLNAVAPSTLTQLTPGMVLSEDIMAFTSIDPNLQTQTIQMTFPTAQQATTVQGNPFLSQVGALTPRGSSANSVTIYSPVTSTTFSSNGSAFTSAVPANQIQVQAHHQQVTLSPLDKSPQPKTSPTKAGRKTAQSLNQQILSGTDMEVSPQQKSKKGKSATGQENNEEIRKKLRCQYCNKLFNKNFDLQQHVRCHTGEKPFQCIVCGRAFAQKSNVKKHMTTHKVWPAGTASTLPKPTKLVELVEDIESGITQCNSTMAGDGQEPDHSLQPVRELNIGSTTDANGQMNVSVDNSYLCQYCPEKFKTYFQLKSHMVLHKDEQVYKCVLKTCGSMFKSLDMFLEHIKTHEDGMSYRCHLCNKTFPSLYELGVHQYSHSLYPSQTRLSAPRYYQCTKCLNKYSSPEALDHHLSTASHHYPCPTCMKVFTCERYLRRHLSTHGTVGQFECQVCFKRFKAENYLKMHSLIHSGAKPFQCEQCNAAFNRKDKLKRHMLIHVTVKKYKCPFKSLTGCEMEFNRPDKLKAHIISHSGIKPFKCRECGKSFCRKPSLLEHERSHRSDFRFRCEKCGKGFFRPKLFHGHKCNPITDKDGTLIVPTPRARSRRKIGRPRKRMITVTADSQKSTSTMITRRRGRPTRREGGERLGMETEATPAEQPPVASSSRDSAPLATLSSGPSSGLPVAPPNNTASPTDTIKLQPVFPQPQRVVTVTSSDQSTDTTHTHVTSQSQDTAAVHEGQVKDTTVEVSFAGMEFTRTAAAPHLTTSAGYVVQLQSCDITGGSSVDEANQSESTIVTMSAPSVISPNMSHQSIISPATQQLLQPAVIGQVELVDLSNAQVVSTSEGQGVEIEITNSSNTSGVDLVAEEQHITVEEHMPAGVNSQGMHTFIVEDPTPGVDGVQVRRQVVFATPGSAAGEMVTCVAEITEDGDLETHQGRQIQHYVSETDPVLQGTESLLKASEDILRSMEEQ
ncbi:zinc finger protein 341-like isoform X2 [Liolophura sinensis]|uniref:zinc finger protein 341-like isoform X2 n=1 Tax=Liolophura sinensis TaxID=3198878 RepID=UPI003158E26D